MDLRFGGFTVFVTVLERSEVGILWFCGFRVFVRVLRRPEVKDKDYMP